MLAGHALSGLLASQPEDKGWNIEALAVVSLKIADTVLEFDKQNELPSLKVEDKSGQDIESPVVIDDQQQETSDEQS